MVDHVQGRVPAYPEAIMNRLTTISISARSIAGRVCIFSSVLVLLGLSLAIGGLAHDSALIRNIGMGVFVISVLPLLGVLLLAWLAERQP